MGKQINFYMLPEDEGKFLRDAESIAPLVVFEYTSSSESFQPTSGLPEKGTHGWFQLWIWSPAQCQPPVVRWVPQQKYYVIDGVGSEVVEFSRSNQHEQSIVRGRLWAELKERDGSPKSASFASWFESLVKLLRRTFVKLPSGDYIGPAAERFVANGGKLRSMLTAPVVKVIHH